MGQQRSLAVARHSCWMAGASADSCGTRRRLGSRANRHGFTNGFGMAGVLKTRMASATTRSTVEMRKQALKSAVMMRVGSRAAQQLRWARSVMPTLLDVEPLRAAVTRAGADASVLLRDFSIATPLERSDGNWEDIMASIGGEGAASVAAASRAFDENIAPAMEAVATRQRLWACWRGVLTWAAARNVLDDILPMSLTVFQALTFDMLSVLCSATTIRAVWDAIQAQHRRTRLSSPIEGGGGYSRLMRCLTRFAGHQSAFKLPISKEWIREILMQNTLDPEKLVPLRNALATVVATIACLRPSEGARLQVCDLWFDYDARAGGRYATGTLALNVYRRKNDQERRGHLPRLGRAQDPDLDIVHQLKTYLRVAGLTVHPDCVKAQRPHARCQVCKPVFGRAVKEGALWRMTGGEGSASAFSAMIPAALQAIGVSGSGFSGICARRGGITTAIEAGVPEVVLWMQSGHAQERSARRYIAVSRGRPEALYKTFEAFDL
jgi:hypothetical protein